MHGHLAVRSFGFRGRQAIPAPSLSFLGQNHHNAVVVFHGKDEGVQNQAQQRPRLVQAQGLHEGSEPAAVVGKFQEFVQAAKAQLGPEGLALANDESMILERSGHFRLISRVANDIVHRKRPPAEHPAEEPGIRLFLQARKTFLGAADQGPETARGELVPNFRRECTGRDEAGNKMRADQVERDAIQSRKKRKLRGGLLGLCGVVVIGGNGALTLVTGGLALASTSAGGALISLGGKEVFFGG